MKTNQKDLQSKILWKNYNGKKNKKKEIINSNINHKINKSIKIKCILLGEAAVGKTRVIISFISEYYGNHDPHLQVGRLFHYKKINIGENKFELEILDTAGAPFFRTIVEAYLRGSGFIVIMFSFDNKTSLQEVISFWFPMYKRNCPDTPFILVGNKADLINERSITEEEIEEVINITKPYRYIECSCVTGENIENVFLEGIASTLK